MHPVICAILLAVTATLTTPTPFDGAKAHAIDAIARGELHAHSTPGLAIGIVQDGLLVYSRGFGNSDIVRRRAVRPDTAFYAGAVSEQFTAASVLLLAQDKKLTLSDRVTRFVPELSVARNVTIAQLLLHTSGLPDPGKISKLEDAISAMAHMAPVAPPGTQFHRSPIDYAIAALIVQRVSGIPFSDFMQSRIFEPLIMRSSFLTGDQGVGVNRALGYARVNGRFVEIRPPDAASLYGSGDLVTTIDDLAKWDIGLPLLLNVDSVRTMWTSGLTGTQSGMGWTIDRRAGHTYVWQSGSVAGYHAMNALLPEEHIAVIVLANAGGTRGDLISPERVASRILDIVSPVAKESFTNAVVQRATEWIGRLQRFEIDRTQLTPSFSQYLTDQVVIRTDLKSSGPLESIVPVESFTRSGDTVYIFEIKFRRGSMRYEFALAPDGKIDALVLQPVS